MTKEQVFGILGIPVTKDLEAIKNAYRDKLVNVNPEDDPEGFKRLRESYEEAMRYAQEEEKEKDEIDLWIDQLAQIYNSMEKRIKPESYKELFKDEICQNLDTQDAVKERFLLFVADYYYFPQEVFQLFDEVFSIVDTQEDLKEKFSPNYIDYLVNQITYPSFLNYSLFSYLSLEESEANYDGFINDYFEVRSLIEQGELDKASDVLDNIKNHQVYHPYVEVEKLRIFSQKNDMDSALKISDQLLEKYQGDPYISFMCGRTYYETENYEQGISLFEEILAENEKHFSANYYMIKNLLRIDEEEAAKEKALWLYEFNPGNEPLLDLLKEINDVLIRKYFERYNASGKTEDAMEYAWCLFQNDKYEECLYLLDNVRSQMEGTYEFTNIYGRVLFAADRYIEALPYLTKWNQMIVEAVEDGSELYQKKKKRESESFHLLGLTHLEMGNYEKAIQYLQKGLNVEKNINIRLSYLERISYGYVKMNEFEKAVDICDEILSIDKGYYPAYLQRQEAFFGLHNGQGVIDDYYNAINIWNGYVKPYLTAMRTFYNYNQYKDMLEVYDRAKEAEIESRALEFERLKALRMLAEGDEARDEVGEQLNAFLEEEEKLEESDIEGIDKVYFELALSYIDRDLERFAISNCKKAVDLCPDNMNYIWNLGDFYYKDWQYHKALSCYTQVSKVWSGNPYIYVDLGKTYKELENYVKAEEQFKKAIEMDSNLDDVHHKLADLYNDWHTESCDHALILKAIEEETLQLEVEEHPYYYKCRGGYKLSAGMPENAVEDYKKAMDMNPKDLFAYRQLGNVYHAMSDYKNAIETYLRGIEIMEKDEDGSHKKLSNLYVKLANTYTAMEEYTLAEKYLLKNIEEIPGEDSAYDDLFDVYMRTAQYDKAEGLLETWSKAKNNRGNKILSENKEDVKKLNIRARVFSDEKTYQDVLDFYNQAKDTLTSDDLVTLGEILIETYVDFKAALEVAEAESKLKLDFWDRMVNTERQARCYFYLGQKDQAKKLAQKALKMIDHKYKNVDSFVHLSYSYAWRAGFVGKLYAYAGDIEKAFYYINQMTLQNKCQYCSFKDCHERYLWGGMVYDCLGDLEKAKENYMKVLELYPNNPDAKTLLQKVEERW